MKNLKFGYHTALQVLFSGKVKAFCFVIKAKGKSLWRLNCWVYFHFFAALLVQDFLTDCVMCCMHVTWSQVQSRRRTLMQRIHSRTTSLTCSGARAAHAAQVARLVQVARVAQVATWKRESADGERQRKVISLCLFLVCLSFVCLFRSQD